MVIDPLRKVEERVGRERRLEGVATDECLCNGDPIHHKPHTFKSVLSPNSSCMQFSSTLDVPPPYLYEHNLTSHCNNTTPCNLFNDLLTFAACFMYLHCVVLGLMPMLVKQLLSPYSCLALLPPRSYLGEHTFGKSCSGITL